MLKYLIVFSAFILFITGCEKDEDTDQLTSNQPKSTQFETIDNSGYPDAITNYIGQNYPDQSIVEIYMRTFDDGSTTYEVELNNGNEYYFDSNGNYLGMDDSNVNISNDSIPQLIGNYISSNYPAQSIIKAESEMEDGIRVYEITLSNGLELYFDESGMFLSLDDDSDHISTSELPQNILDYVTANYPDATIIYAEMDIEDGATEYEIKLDNGMELEFDGSGNYVSSDDNHIPIADLPQAIIDYVETNYPDNSIAKAELEYEDGQQMYEIELDNEIELYFDMNGNFLFMEND